jgi:SAM-dependent methyltransferase
MADKHENRSGHGHGHDHEDSRRYDRGHSHPQHDAAAHERHDDHQDRRGHSHEPGADEHEHQHDQGRHDHHEHRGRGHSHTQEHTHEAHGDQHGHDHSHSPGPKTHFHDPAHAAEFDRRSTISGIRASLTEKMIEMLALNGAELVLDLATGTGRAARPVSKHIKTGRIVGVDQALAMLDVGHQHVDPIPNYRQCAGEAAALPFKSDTFDRTFVSFSLHHFASPQTVVQEVLRVMKSGARFVVLDPIIEEARDAVDVALEKKINEIPRRGCGGTLR